MHGERRVLDLREGVSGRWRCGRMLVLSGKLNERIVLQLPDGVKISVVIVNSVKNGVVQLGIEAPPEVRIRREDLLQLPSDRQNAEGGGSLMDRLRQAILERNESLNKLSAACGVDRGRLSRFMRGERDLTLTAAAKLCDALDLQLMSRPNAAGGSDQPPA
jgi:carbon storage regulator CsrA